MKRVTTLALFAGFALAATLAATDAAHAVSAWTFGFKGGINVADVGGDDADSLGTDSRTGFIGGLFLEGDLTNHVGVRFEGLYAMKGASAGGAGLELTSKLDYLEFPILVVVGTQASDIVTLNAFAGPVVGFNIGAEVELEGEFLGFPITASEDISDEISSFEFGITFGAGAEFKAGSILIVADGRYTLGLTNVASDDDFDLKNRGFSLMAGLGFPLGTR